MTRSVPTGGTSGFNPRTIGIIIAMSVMSFGALATLLAWGPELQSKDRAGAHAYSSSALGYAGFVKLLEYQGNSVTVSRTRRGLEDHQGLAILAPGITGGRLEEYLPLSGPTLIILPKWNGQADRLKPQWHEKTALQSTQDAQAILENFDEDAQIKHSEPRPKIIFGTRPFQAQFDETLQVIKSKSLETIIAAPGGALLAKDPYSNVYILSDPDLANNFGLAHSENARLILSILRDIEQEDSTSILFDATLNGLEQSTNLLRIVLDVPFLGATLTLLFGFFLLGWSACVRFGSPALEERAFALGKQALADSTAGLIAMTHREQQMAPGYLALTRKSIAKSLSAPSDLSEDKLNALLERLGPEAASGQTWTQISGDFQVAAKTREDLLNKAQRLYRWRKEKTHGHS